MGGDHWDLKEKIYVKYGGKNPFVCVKCRLLGPVQYIFYVSGIKKQPVNLACPG